MATTCKHGTILYGTCLACEREDAKPVRIDNPAQRAFTSVMSKSLNKELNKSLSFVGPPRPPVIQPRNVTPFPALHAWPPETPERYIKKIRRCPFCLANPSLEQDCDSTWSVCCINKRCLVAPITLPFSTPRGAAQAWNGVKTKA